MTDRPEAPQILLSTMKAGGAQRRLALVASLALLVAFAAVIPFARMPLGPIPAFVPVYGAALLVIDLVTAALLAAQYSIGRSRALNILTAGYLFAALIGIPRVLVFAGAFGAPGLFGAEPQSTAWLYIGWHAGFPLAVIAYGLHKHGEPAPSELKGSPLASILITLLIVTGVVIGVSFLTIAGHAWLPPVMAGGRYSDAMLGAVAVVWGLNIAALLLLATRRPHSVLDLWLTVVMIAWMCDIALNAASDQQRFDVGFYAGRVFGLSAASLVLAVLISEVTNLYDRLARSMAAERRERERRLHEMEAVLIHLSRVSELGQIVSSLIHEVNQPLAAISNYLGATLRLAAAGTPERIAPVVTKAAEQADRAVGIIRHLRDFVAKRETDKAVENLPNVLNEALKLALSGSGAQAPVVERRLDPAASFAYFDRVQIEQVIFNLVRNAVEAMADSSRRQLVITTATTAASTGDDMVEVSVADTGPGLPAEVRARLFEPFVTTKASGLGVGLSICRFIVETHGGRLQAEDNPGGGTIFRFTLPLAPVTPAGEPSRSAETDEPLTVERAPPGPLYQGQRS